VLGYVALIFILVASVKVGMELQRYRSVFVAHGITSLQLSALQLSLLLYALCLLAFALPVSWLRFLAPVPFGFLLLAPGILLGRRISARLDTGYDAASQASRMASNAFWLGIAALVFVAGNIIVRLIYRGFGS